MFAGCASRAVCIVGAATLALAAQAAPAGAHFLTERVSLGPGGMQGGSISTLSVISADGRFVAFSSRAANLVPGDTNRTGDVFVRDRNNGTTERVSLGPGGVQSNAPDFAFDFPSISADGRFVAFSSLASNLVPGDTNGTRDVFVRDRNNGTTERVSLGPGGVQGNAPDFGLPSISADGRFVAFASEASNLVPGDTNEAGDVFVRDRNRRTTRRVSLGPGGVQGNAISFDPSISADGRFVAFASEASNLVPGDTNEAGDVFVRDRNRRTTRRVSLGPGGVQGDSSSSSPSISADGRLVAFLSRAGNLVPGDTNGTDDVFVRDRNRRTTRRVSLGPGGVQGDSFSSAPSISADGRFVAFQAHADNLVPDDTNGETDVFVRDRRTGTTRRVSLGPGGVQGNGRSDVLTSISADGRFVAFSSFADNLVPDDTNGTGDVFVRGPAP